jgi:hypothetical protein
MAIVFEFAPVGAITAGAAVASDPAVYDAVSGAVSYDTTVKFRDLTASAKCANPATTPAILEQDLPAAAGTRYLTRILRVAGFTAGTVVALCRWRSGSTSLGEVRMLQTGALVLRDNVAGTSLGTSKTLIAAGAPFRLGIDLTGSTVTMRIFTDPEAPNPAETIGPRTHTWGPVDNVLDGAVNTSATASVWVLYAADGDTTKPGLTRWPGEDVPGLRTYVTAGGVRSLVVTRRA